MIRSMSCHYDPLITQGRHPIFTDDDGIVRECPDVYRIYEHDFDESLVSATECQGYIRDIMAEFSAREEALMGRRLTHTERESLLQKEALYKIGSRSRYERALPWIVSEELPEYVNAGNWMSYHATLFEPSESDPSGFKSPMILTDPKMTTPGNRGVSGIRASVSGQASDSKGKATASRAALIARDPVVPKTTRSTRQSIAEESAGSMNEFIVSDNESLVVDETNSQNDADSYDTDDFAATPESLSGSLYVPKRRHSSSPPLPVRVLSRRVTSTAVKGDDLAMRDKSDTKNRLEVLLREEYINSGGDPSLYSTLSQSDRENLVANVISSISNEVRVLSQGSMNVSVGKGGTPFSETEKGEYNPHEVLSRFDDDSYSRVSSRAPTASVREVSVARGGSDTGYYDEEEEGLSLITGDDGDGDGGDGGDDSDHDDDGGDPKPVKKAGKPKEVKAKGVVEVDKFKKEPGTKATAKLSIGDIYCDEYVKKFGIDLTEKYDNRSEVEVMEPWREETTKSIKAQCRAIVAGYSSVANIVQVIDKTNKNLADIIFDDTPYLKEKSSPFLYNQGGRDTVELTKNLVHSCEFLTGHLLEAMLRVKFPLENEQRKCQKSVQEFTQQLEELKLTGVTYQGELCLTKEDLGKRPTMEVYDSATRGNGFELNKILFDLNETARREANRLKSLGAYDELQHLEEIRVRKEQAVIGGFTKVQQTEFAELLECYKQASRYMTTKLSNITKCSNKLLREQLLQALYEGIKVIFRTISNKIHGCLKGEILKKVQFCLDKEVILFGASITLPLSSRNLFGIWHNLMEHFSKPSIENYINYIERRLKPMEGTLEEQQRRASLQDHESRVMRYDEMPPELIYVATSLQMLTNEAHRVEGVRFLWDACKDVRNKTPAEVPQYIKSLNLKANMDAHLASYDTMVVQSKIGSKKYRGGQGHFGSGYDSEREDGEGMLGESKQSSSNKNRQGGDGKKQSKQSKPYKPPKSLKLEPVPGTDLWTSASGPFPLTSEITVDQNVWVRPGTDESKARRYTSVSAACSKCVKAMEKDADNKPAGGGHSPLCFISKCNKCQKFGHVGANCLHT